MLQIEIINTPYYIGEACDCCRGYWYNRYFIKVDGEFIRYDPHPEFKEIEPDAMSWSDLEFAKAFIFDEYVNKVQFECTINDPGLPDDDIYGEDE